MRSTSPSHCAIVARVFLALSGAMALQGCTDYSRIVPGSDVGRQPVLAQGTPPLIPTVNIAPAIGWPEGGKPTVSAGLSVSAFARDLDHPRWLYVLPNGDVLVAETNAPPKPEQGWSLEDWAMKLVMNSAGAGVASANRITLLRDKNGDGVAELRETFLTGLHSPFGMALVGNKLYVANTDAVLEFAYAPGQTHITSAPRTVATLPAGPINHHWTKGLLASADGSSLYVSVGSNSNIAERGMDVEAGRAAILKIDRASGETTVFADGLRNPVGMAWSSDDQLWVAVNERDALGSDLVPDYLTSVSSGDFYGWPWWWYGTHRDSRVKAAAPPSPRQVKTPVYALGSHVAPLGLAAAARSPLIDALPTAVSAAPGIVGMFVGLHGSWNRRPLSGYKVVWVPFENGQPVGAPVDILSGFVSPDEHAWGRPVGVAVDATGTLLVADDVGNAVWQVRADPVRLAN
jgi:glucose/arabinose dehydrogenase